MLIHLARPPLCTQKDALHQSPYSAPLGLAKEDCEVRMEEGESEEGEGDSGDLESEASFASTMYDDDRYVQVQCVLTSYAHCCPCKRFWI